VPERANSISRVTPELPVTGDQRELDASRRRLVVDGIAMAASAVGFGFVFGLSARAAGLTPVDASAMSLFVFAGASQFAAVGYVASGFGWIGIIVLTALINARHFLYSAAIAPYLSDERRVTRAAMAHVLTDEAFALSIAHFNRIGRGDRRAYWIASVGIMFIPWNLASVAGVLVGGAIPDPNRFGLDVIFPAAMAGIAVALISGRRELVAALAGIMIGIALGLAFDPAVGVVAGGLLGPIIAMFAVRTPPAADDEPPLILIAGVD
jgi:4-azaleucine resistance transporter AzlC